MEAKEVNLSGNILLNNVFFLSSKDGSTALFKAAFKGHNCVVEELLKFSPSLGLLKVDVTVTADSHILSSVGFEYTRSQV